MDNACHDMGKKNVEQGTYQQGNQDADGHVALRLFGLLGRCTDAVESQKGEKDDGGSPENTGESEFTYLSGIGRNVGNVVVRLDKLPSQDDENQDNSYFEKYNQVVDKRTFAGAAHQQQTDQDDNADGRKVDDASVPGAGRQMMGELNAYALKEDHQVAAPADAYGGGGYGIFQHQIPAYDPGYQLSHGGI